MTGLKLLKFPFTYNGGKLLALLHVLKMCATYIDLSTIKNVHWANYSEIFSKSENGVSVSEHRVANLSLSKNPLPGDQLSLLFNKKLNCKLYYWNNNLRLPPGRSAQIAYQ